MTPPMKGYPRISTFVMYRMRSRIANSIQKGSYPVTWFATRM